MVLKDDRKAMIAIFDALIFLTLLSLVSVSIFSFAAVDHEETIAKDVSDDLFSIRLRASDIYPTEDTQTYPIADLVAADMNTGNSDIASEYLASALDGLVNATKGYRLVISYGESTLELTRGRGGVKSSYSADIAITGGTSLRAELQIL